MPPMLIPSPWGAPSGQLPFGSYPAQDIHSHCTSSSACDVRLIFLHCSIALLALTVLAHRPVARLSLQVIDARDPMGTRCFHLERHIRKHLRHKHLLLLLNKCDLVRPTPLIRSSHIVLVCIGQPVPVHTLGCAYLHWCTTLVHSLLPHGLLKGCSR